MHLSSTSTSETLETCDSRVERSAAWCVTLDVVIVAKAHAYSARRPVQYSASETRHVVKERTACTRRVALCRAE